MMGRVSARAARMLVIMVLKLKKLMVRVNRPVSRVAGHARVPY